MDILLCAEGDAGATFRHELQRAWPQGRWLEDGPGLDRSTIEVAVVANPSPGRLQGLPRLRLIQSLWAGVERLLADPTVPAGVPIARMVEYVSARVGLLQQGRISIYLLYSFVTLIALLLFVR